MNSTKLFKKAFLSALSVVILLAMAGLNAFAQSGTTSVRGTVTDQAGAVVAGANVKLVNPNTGFNRSTTSNSEGIYVFASVLPGTYQVEIEAKGFKKTVKQGVVATVDSTVEANVSMETGQVTEVVNVTTNATDAITNTTDASLGNNFGSRQITQLPTDSRNVPDLLSLQPGVTRDGSVAGGRSDQANITLDGIDVNDQQTGAAFSSVLRVTAESVEEFRITTTNANASQGRSSGAQVSLITRRGDNQFRGSLFGFHRPDKFSANNFFNNRAGSYSQNDLAVQLGSARAGDEKVPRPNLKRTIYGGRLGGPIIKDKLFFFYSYEGFRERQSVSVVRNVPTLSLAQGNLSFRGAAPGDPAGTNRIVTINTANLNTIFPTVLMNPASIAVLAQAAARYPVNDDSVGDGLNVGGYRFNAPAPIDQDTHVARFDWIINTKQELSARFNYQNDSAIIPQQFPDTISPEFWNHPTGYGFNHIWSISSNKVNSLRYGMTRQAFTSGGDSNENSISFRFVFSPKAFSRSLSRVTTVHNITDDFSWVKGEHTIQFGGNLRLIDSKRRSLAAAYDAAITNPSFYASSGRVLDRPISAAGYTVPASSRTSVQNAMAALIGRFSQYTSQYNYDIAGNVLPTGTEIVRNFATEEYEVYAQDIWKPFRNLTITGGVRYSLSRPVYEKEGFQVVPNIKLGDFFESRRSSAQAGTPYNQTLNFVLAGPKNNAPGFYSMDWNNIQPRIAFAWQPNFKNKYLKAIFGGEDKTTIRGGYAVTNDYFGQQLAVTFDGLTTLGFTTSDTIAANTYNVTTNPAPRFTGFNQVIRTLPLMSAPNRFQTPADEDQRIESSLDATLVSPRHQTWSLTYGRELPKGMYFEASYIGRRARNLLATRDALQQNNLVDSRSGMDWFTAAGLLADLRERNTPVTAVGNIPYFQNLFPNLGQSLSIFWDDPTYAGFTPTQAAYYMVARDGYDILDWTFIQVALDDDFSGAGRWSNLYFHPQYAAFSAFSTIGESDYHGGAFSFRQRLGNTLTYDINYTFSKSMDNASGLQTAGTYGSAFILNALSPEDNRSVSDFDIRHLVNANFLFEMPIGKGRRFFSDLNPVADAILGGWQMSGIYRWNTGYPTQTPFDAAQWATNWNVQSNGVRIRNVSAGAVRSTANLFSDPVAAYKAFRNARAGETGDRNVLRDPGFSTLDLGLLKTFRMPWEGHNLEFRWEVFNVTNVQYFTTTNVTRGTLGLGQDPGLNDPGSEFGKIFTDIQGQPRRMQFAFRYSF